LLWTYDPAVAQAARHKLRVGWGVEALPTGQDKIYVGNRRRTTDRDAMAAAASRSGV